MKYVKTYENYKKYRNEEVVNEELLGGIINFFKKLWDNIAKDIEALGKSPSFEKIDDFVEKRFFNPSDKNYIFKSILDEFKKKQDANNEDCFKLVDDTLDAISTTNMQSLYDQLSKFYGKMLAPVEIIKFYFSTARNKAIKDFKFAGGPDTQAGQEPKIDPKLKKLELTDTTHLPDFKKILAPTGEDRKKKKEVAITWVEKTLIPKILKYIQEITPEQVEKYLEIKKIPMPEGSPEGGYKIGDTVIYKREKFNQDEWGKLTDDEKKDTENPKMKELQKEQIGVKAITKIDDKNVTFMGDDGKEIIKPIEDILMKVEKEKEEYKVGDTVVYKREKFNQEEWNKLTDDEKKDQNNPKMKELEKEQIGIKAITKIDDKNVTFMGADNKEIIKPLDSILMKLEVKAEGQEELVKKLGELKTKKPEDIQKVSKFVDFISNDANKDKIADIDKIIGGEAQGGA